MPLRFYRRFRAGPFRMNLSKSGVSYSFGRKGAWLTTGHNHARVSVGLPGSGLGWYEQRRLLRPAISVPSAPSWRLLGWIIVAIIIGAGVLILWNWGG
jgi:Protein of unknown function (DUF4236)